MRRTNKHDATKLSFVNLTGGINLSVPPEQPRSFHPCKQYTGPPHFHDPFYGELFSVCSANDKK